MKSNKLKIGFAAMAFALIGAGFTSVQALEYWRPDKDTGVQINPSQCQLPSSQHCATIYPDNSETPVGTSNGNFAGM
ncbi:hypothetical protein OKW96_16465 [Sphingobacterium sp. KU25419]|nr:hypothetical protein OKW96_16465 [Sphingobacterium sp. KU25419]